MTYKIPASISIGQIYEIASNLMNPEDIDHHGNGHGLDDLYLRYNPVSAEIVSKLEKGIKVEKFWSNPESEKDGVTHLWYDIPFAYPVKEK